jgi:hypothetical protein
MISYFYGFAFKKSLKSHITQFTCYFLKKHNYELQLQHVVSLMKLTLSLKTISGVIPSIEVSILSGAEATKPMVWYPASRSFLATEALMPFSCHLTELSLRFCK